MKFNKPAKVHLRQVLGFLLVLTGPALRGITLEEAREEALARAPELRAAEAARAEQRGLLEQAGRHPNPELGLEAENWGGTGTFSGQDAAEYTVSLGIPVELGGKRRSRLDLAEVESGRVDLEGRLARMALLAKVERRFMELCHAQAKLGLAEKLLASREAAAEAVRAQRREGAAGGLEGRRTEVGVSVAQAKLEMAEREEAAASRRLGRLLGVRLAAQASPPSGLGEDPVRILPLEELQGRLQGAERWAWAGYSRELQEARVAVARADAWPDLSVTGGRRWFQDPDDEAWVFGVSLGIPLFDRNRGEIAAAESGLTQATATVAATRRDLLDALDAAYGRFSAAHASAARTSRETLPLAQETYDLVAKGYRLGRYDLLTLLEAEQTFFEVEAQLIESRYALFQALVDLRELLGNEAPFDLESFLRP